MTFCRCGEAAAAVCHLCKAEICGFHKGAQPVSTVFEGYTRIRLEPCCFPSCTSAFGAPEEREVTIKSPVARA